MLTTRIRVFVDERAPALHVPPAVVLGQEIVVKWEASNKLDSRVSHADDWIGLYRKGDCKQIDYYHDTAATKVSSERSLLSSKARAPSAQNKCYIASARLP